MLDGTICTEFNFRSDQPSDCIKCGNDVTEEPPDLCHPICSDCIDAVVHPDLLEMSDYFGG